jgi:pSer/pThr/pTyr-binding forkhead associated (FHA) protein
MMITVSVSSVTHPSPSVSHDVDAQNRVALVVIFHPETGRLGDRYLLYSAGAFEIGRADAADISFPGERSISRHQARIRRSRDKTFIEDLDSTNGTLVNGRFIRDSLELHSGDRIQVGLVHLKFLHESDVEYAYHEHIHRSLSSREGRDSEAILKPASTDSPSIRQSTPGPRPGSESASRVWIPQLVSILLLLIAFDTGNPYAYYTLLRWICCGCFTYLAFTALDRGKSEWAWILGVLALLYNPIWPLHLTRQMWTSINVATIGLAVVSVMALRPRDSNEEV